MILCIGTTPAAQRVMVFRKVALDAVNRAVTTLDGMAGKSVNVAKVLKFLGEQPIAAGFAGGERGQALRNALAALRIDHDLVEVAAPTRQCITVIDESAGTHTELVEESRPVASEDYDKLAAIIRAHLPRSRAVVMSGSLTPGAIQDLYADCTRLANAHGALSVVDAQGTPLIRALEAAPGLVKPNRTELATTVGFPLTDEASVLAAMRRLHEMGAQQVVVTAGRDAVLSFDGTRFWRIIPPAVAVKNPIGSGDAFTAALVWRLLKGDDLGEASRWGAAAGAANALSLMPGELQLSDVERLVAAIRLPAV
jgi:tagatose 6-phosphate kinase